MRGAVLPRCVLIRLRDAVLGGGQSGTARNGRGARGANLRADRDGMRRSARARGKV
jgi:hypothetical protein